MPIAPLDPADPFDDCLGIHVEANARRLKVGDRVPLPPRKVQIRPVFSGAGGPSFKPSRNSKK